MFLVVHQTARQGHWHKPKINNGFVDKGFSEAITSRGPSLMTTHWSVMSRNEVRL
jgi:hypothetical protein